MNMKLSLLFVSLLFWGGTILSEANPPKNKVIKVGNVTFTMIYVEPGSFVMGATSDEDYDEREHPSHQVTLTKGYYIGETEVTQALWEMVMGNNPSDFIGKDKPVDNVNWNDCQAFISILNNLTNSKFRLPTEAEWEFAAKGGNLSKGYIYSGSNNADDVAWYIVNSGDNILKDKIILFGNNNNNMTHDVKSKKPNELGIYDMSGNVGEWCEDGYATFSPGKQYDPKGPSLSKEKVKKGGDYRNPSKQLKTTFRVGFEPEFSINSYGFRLALDE